jgi:hypothetical protein
MRAAPALALSLVAALSAPSRAAAEEALPLVHPIYAQLPELAESEVTKQAFAAAARRYGLGPVEVIDVPGVAAPRAPVTLNGAVAKTVKLAWDEALPALEAVATEVEAMGGAGLTTAELSDLYLYRAMATARADWNSPAAPETEAANPGRARAFEDYTRAAALSPTRTLNARELPPQVVADFGRAVEAARKLPRGTLIVRGDADAMVRLDGAEPVPVAGGLTFRDVAPGEHLLAVEELGRVPWGTQVKLADAALEQTVTIPNRAAFSLSDATAAEHARRMGARFALVAERKPGAGARIELRLVDLTGAKRDGAFVSTTGDEKGSIDAAVMRLDEQARKLRQLEVTSGTPIAAVPPPAGEEAPVLLAPPPGKAKFSESPGLWARDHWPLLTAVGVVIGAAIVLGIAAGN